MKKYLLTLLITIVVFSTLNAQVLQPEYSQWLFVQSDKALQFRIAVVKYEGNTGYLQLQFRVNNEDEVYCKSHLCNGMLLSLRNKNVGDNESTNYSFIFEKSFVGLDNIYTWPQLITTELKTWPDGSKRFWSPLRGIVYTKAGSDTEYAAAVPDACVDVLLTSNPSDHRCKRHGFDAAIAVIVK